MHPRGKDNVKISIAEEAIEVYSCWSKILELAYDYLFSTNQHKTRDIYWIMPKLEMKIRSAI
jgi:hypothetical protein